MGDDVKGLAKAYRRDGFVFPIDVLSTVDPAERDALDTLLASGGAQLNCTG